MPPSIGTYLRGGGLISSLQQLRILIGFFALLFSVGMHAANAGTFTYSDDTLIVIGTETFTVKSGSGSDAFILESDSLYVTVATGETFTMTSANKKGFTVSTTDKVDVVCETSQSKVTVTGPRSVTITPLSAQCGANGGASSGSGSGSSAAAAPTPAATVPPASVKPPTELPTAQKPADLSQKPSVVAPEKTVLPPASQAPSNVPKARVTDSAPKPVVVTPLAALVESVDTVDKKVAQKLPTVTQALKRGSTGTQVRALQEVLKANGYLAAGPNGVFGPATVKALAQFKIDMGLTKKNDKNAGLLDDTTRYVINKSLGKKVSEPKTKKPVQKKK